MINQQIANSETKKVQHVDFVEMVNNGMNVYGFFFFLFMPFKVNTLDASIIVITVSGNYVYICHSID